MRKCYLVGGEYNATVIETELPGEIRMPDATYKRSKFFDLSGNPIYLLEDLYFDPIEMPFDEALNRFIHGKEEFNG